MVYVFLQKSFLEYPLISIAAVSAGTSPPLPPTSYMNYVNVIDAIKIFCSISLSAVSVEIWLAIDVREIVYETLSSECCREKKLRDVKGGG